MNHNRFTWALVILVLVILVLLLLSGLPFCKKLRVSVGEAEAAPCAPPAEAPSAESAKLDELGAQFEALEMKVDEVAAETEG